MGQHQHDPLVDRAAGEVVQQAQRRLVGVVDVVDDEEQPGPGGRHAHQLGRRDEQPLVAVLAGPAEIASGQGPLDLGPVVVAPARPAESGWRRHSALSASSTGE